MDFSTIYTNMLRKVAVGMGPAPAQPAKPAGAGVSAGGMPGIKPMASPTPPTPPNPEEIKNKAKLQGWQAFLKSMDGGNTTAQTGAPAMNRVGNMTTVSSKPVMGINKMQSVITHKQASALMKLAAGNVQAPKPIEQPPLTVGAYNSRTGGFTNPNGPEGSVPNQATVSPRELTKHHYYDVPKVNGRPQVPQIAPATQPPASTINNPPIMEYKQDTNEYQMHQYPYMKHDYPTSSPSMFREADKLLDPNNPLLSPETKQNYNNMEYKGDPATMLQYAEYLKWRNATGGKTNPQQPISPEQQLQLNQQ